jgi:class 3 adenylate cyclase
MTADPLTALATILLFVGIAFPIAWWRGRRQLAKVRTALRAKSADLENLQLAFSRFAPEEIVERIIASGVSSQGERKQATVLFADLVGFTAISERTEPDVLVRILNGYFERMSRVITEHRGHISTLIGDGILALFGALEPNPWQGNDAVHAALAMRAELADYNRELEAEGLPTLGVGIGLHSGSGVSGLVGSRELMQFTLVGRIVNLAARVQDLTRQFDVDILLTRVVQEEIDARFVLRELPATRVRGIEEPVPIYAVESFSGER